MIVDSSPIRCSSPVHLFFDTDELLEFDELKGFVKRVAASPDLDFSSLLFEFFLEKKNLSDTRRVDRIHIGKVEREYFVIPNHRFFEPFLEKIRRFHPHEGPMHFEYNFVF
jgi:hypothetical protein